MVACTVHSIASPLSSGVMLVGLWVSARDTAMHLPIPGFSARNATTLARLWKSNGWNGIGDDPVVIFHDDVVVATGSG